MVRVNCVSKYKVNVVRKMIEGKITYSTSIVSVFLMNCVIKGGIAE